MKKIILLLLLHFGMTAQNTPTNSGIQPAEKSEVPTLVIDQFTKDHPQAQASWSKDGDNFKAEFVNPENRMNQVIVYDRNGQVVSKDNPLDAATPGAVTPGKSEKSKKKSDKPKRAADPD